MLPEVRGSVAVARWRLRFLFPNLVFAVTNLAFAVADLAIFDLGQVNLRSHHRRVALGVQCCCAALLSLFFFRIATFNALLSCYYYC